MKILIFIFLAFTLSVHCLFSQSIDSNKTPAKDKISDDSIKKLIGFTYGIITQGKIDSGIELANQAQYYSRKNKSASNLAASYNALGIAYEKKGNLPMALNSLFECLKIYDSTNNEMGKAYAYGNLGHIYIIQGNLDKALLNTKIGLEIFRENKDKKNIATSYNNLGNIYLKQNRADEALLSYFKAIELEKEISWDGGIAYSYFNIGKVYYQIKKYNDAVDYQKKAIEIEENGYDKAGLGAYYIELGKAFLALKNYKEAEKFSTKGYSIATQLNSIELIKDGALLISEIEAIKGNHKSALVFFKIYSSAKDSLLNLEKTQKIIQTQLQFEYESKEAAQLLEQHKKDELRRIAETKSKMQFNAIIIVLVLAVIFIAFILRSYRGKIKINKKLEVKNIQIQEQKAEVETQKQIIEHTQKELLDSMHYAKRIQEALFATKTTIKKNFGDYCMLFIPKDIVSGDFYWSTETSDYIFLAVCDSTGHGVPGAFMSLLSIGFLSEAINEKNIYQPAEVFDYVRNRIINTISASDQKDGFDGILIRKDLKNNEILICAAHNKPVLVSNMKHVDLPYNKMPVGYGERKETFMQYKLEYQNGDMLYLYTDGYADQFGGQKGKKFKYKQLDEMLIDLSKREVDEQGKLLELAFKAWKGELEQVDDVCIIGIRL